MIQGGLSPDEPERVIRSFDNVRGTTVFVSESKAVADIHDSGGLLDDSKIPKKGPRAALSGHVDFQNLPQITTIPRVIRLVVISTPEGKEKFETLPKLAHVFVNPNLQTTSEVMFPLENPEIHEMLKKIIERD